MKHRRRLKKHRTSELWGHYQWLNVWVIRVPKREEIEGTEKKFLINNGQKISKVHEN